ncbi:MAG: hypothetical protein MUF14_10375, partial [Hyphomonadaceae bacterium]|nr:hypothetical protein [Hyphomonadaceae bacterium]
MGQIDKLGRQPDGRFKVVPGMMKQAEPFPREARLPTSSRLARLLSGTWRHRPPGWSTDANTLPALITPLCESGSAALAVHRLKT